MINIDFLKEIIVQQTAAVIKKETGLQRNMAMQLPETNDFAIIITGIRRCGKSTVLQQFLQHKYQDALYINFDDPRLFDFQLQDFQKLDQIIKEKNATVLMFDEMQVVLGWERYVRQKLDEGLKVFVTGSNASLLSKELATCLTGRHLSYELFPFSYSEYCDFLLLKPNAISVLEYVQTGGFPGYLKNRHEEILTELLNDVLIRDISLRYGVKDPKSLQRLTHFLLANVGNLTSANKLREPSGILSTATVLEYLSHLENSYLIQLVPLFSLSLKKQSVNPKKIYAIDTGLINANVSKLKSDEGHKLENLVYNALRRKHKEIYYHKGRGECDFVTIHKGEISQAIQVCLELTADNRTREFNGLVDALKAYNLKKGTIVTLNQKDIFEYEDFYIEVVPSYLWLQG